MGDWFATTALNARLALQRAAFLEIGPRVVHAIEDENIGSAFCRELTIRERAEVAA